MNHPVNVDNLKSNDTIKIKKADATHPHDDTITWDDTNKTDEWLVIFLTESPFEDCFFHSKNKQSSKISVTPNSLKSYKYSVYFGKTGLHVDPNVIIE